MFTQFTATFQERSKKVIVRVTQPLADNQVFVNEFMNLLTDYKIGKVDVHVSKENVEKFDYYPLLKQIEEKNIATSVVFKDEQENLHDFYRMFLNLRDYLRRERLKQPKELGKKFLKRERELSTKVRPSKIKFNSGLRITPTNTAHRQYQVQNQAQQQHHLEHAVERRYESQTQVQKQNQYANQRQHQVEKHQARQQERRHQIVESVINTENLVTRETLGQFVTDLISLKEVEAVWDNLVGRYAKYMVDGDNKISHVTATAMSIIVSASFKFSDSVDLDDLPNGFGFINTGEKSILYFSEALVKKVPEERQDSPLSPQLDLQDEAVLSYKVELGSLYPFTRLAQLATREAFLQDYEQFCQEHEENFKSITKLLLSPELLPERRQALIELICISSSEKEFLNEVMKDFSDEYLIGLGSVFLTHGGGMAVALLKKIEEMKSSPLYPQFKRIFLDKNKLLLDETFRELALDQGHPSTLAQRQLFHEKFYSWCELVNTKTYHINEMTSLECFDYLLSISLEERVWWEAMCESCSINVKFNRLANAHRYFCEQIKQIDPKLTLPPVCPLTTFNTPVTLKRILTVLENAIDPFDQIQHLDQLDWSPQGVIAASRGASYVSVHHLQRLTPSSSVTEDWSRHKKLILSFLKESLPDWKKDPKDLEHREQFKRIFSEVQRSQGIPAEYDPPEEFYGPVSVHVELLTLSMPVLARDKNGRLQHYRMFSNERSLYPPHSGFGMSVYEDTSNSSEEDGDESFLISRNEINYQTTLRTLFSYSQKLHSIKSLKQFFFRYIGTQLYAYSLDSYIEWYERLSTQHGSKQMACILAACTTGLRNLQAGENVSVVLDTIANFLHHNPDLTNISSHFFGKYYIQVQEEGEFAYLEDDRRMMYTKKDKRFHIQNGSEITSFEVPNPEYFEAKLNELPDSAISVIGTPHKEISKENLIFLLGYNPFASHLDQLCLYLAETAFKPTLTETLLILKNALTVNLSNLFRVVSQHGYVTYKVLEYLLPMPTDLKEQFLNDLTIFPKQQGIDGFILFASLIERPAMLTYRQWISQHQVSQYSQRVLEELIKDKIDCDEIRINVKDGSQLLQLLEEIDADWQLRGEKEEDAVFNDPETISTVLNFVKQPGLEATLEAMNPAILPVLEQVFSQVDITGEEGFKRLTEVEVGELLEAFEQATPAQQGDSDYFFALVKKIIPRIRFKQRAVASTLAGLLHEIGPFIEALGAQLGNLKNMIHAWIKNPPEGQGFLQHETIKTMLLSLIEPVSEHVARISGEFKALNQNPSDETSQKALASLKPLIAFFDNPFKEMNTDGLNFLEVGALKVAFVPLRLAFYKGMKAHLVEMVRLGLTSTIQGLSINECLEPPALLSATVLEFALAELPPLDEGQLLDSLNAVFLKEGELTQFFNALRIWRKPARDAVLLTLYQEGYFSQHPASPSVTELTLILEPLRGLTKYCVTEFLGPLLHSTLRGEEKAQLLEALSHCAHFLRESDFKTLLILGLDDLASLKPFLLILQRFQAAHRYSPRLLRCLLAAYDEEGRAQRVASLTLFHAFMEEQVLHLDTIEACFYFAGTFEKMSGLIEQLQGFPADNRAGLLMLLKHACLQREEQPKYEQVCKLFRLLQDLRQRDGEGYNALLRLYQDAACPDYKALLKILKQAGEPEALEGWIKERALDPFGKWAQVSQQLDVVGVVSFIEEIKPLLTRFDEGFKTRLYNDYSYIISVTKRYCLTVNGQLKTLYACNREELISYFEGCRTRGDGNARLEALAIACLAMFRTTGKYPYHSQIISVLCTLYDRKNMLLGIKTGQGKTVTDALIALMEYAFNGERHVTVASHNQLQIISDYKAVSPYFDYLGIKTALVFAQETTNTLVLGAPIIRYTTPADDSLHRSQLVHTARANLPSPAQETVISGEADASIYDNRSGFNYSESGQDPYNNPIAWVYPLVLKCVVEPYFLEETRTQDDDIDTLRSYLQRHAASQYEQCETLLTDFRLSQLIESAFMVKQMTLKTDYLIEQKTREEYQEEVERSFAIGLFGSDKEEGAILSYGVHQLLHADLNERYKREIASKEMPAFPLDTQIESTDSQQLYSHFKRFGRFIGTTATPGSEAELEEAKKVFDIGRILDIPSRIQGQLQCLDDVFVDESNHFYFGPKHFLDALIRKLKEVSQQPVLITARSIEEADKLAQDLEAAFPGRVVQTIHAESAANHEDFERRLVIASRAGSITVATGLAGRGANFLPEVLKARADYPSDKAYEVAKLASTLLVIKTFLMRFRPRGQFEGRTARDARVGQVMGIYDIKQIASEYRVELGVLPTKEAKIAACLQIMGRLDEEAMVIRQYETRTRQLAIVYQEAFDGLIQAYPEQGAVIKTAKSDFMELAARLWDEALNETDPMHTQANLYVRYEGGKLSCAHLDEATARYGDALKGAFKRLCDDLGLEPLQSDVVSNYPSSELLQSEVAEASIAFDVVRPDKAIDIYLSHKPLVPDAYLKKVDGLKQLSAKQTWLLEGFMTGISAPDDKSIQTTLLQHAKGINEEQLNRLILSWEDVVEKGPFPVEEIEDLRDFFVQQVADSPLLREQVAAMPLTSCYEAMKYLQTSFNLATCHTSARATRDLLRGLAHLSEVMLSPGAPSVEEQNRAKARDLRLFVNEVDLFLEKTKERLEGTGYQLIHRHAGAKIGNINAFRERKEALIAELLAQDGATLPELICSYKAKVASILTYKTSTGGEASALDGTTSGKAFERLMSEVSFLTEPGSRATAYKSQLDTMLANLRSRQGSGFFKDRVAYAEKVSHFEGYVNQIKRLIDQKGAGQSIDNQIRSMQLRMTYDPVLYTSTSNLLKMNSRVTLMKEVQEATDMFLQSRR